MNTAVCFLLVVFSDNQTYTICGDFWEILIPVSKWNRRQTVIVFKFLLTGVLVLPIIALGAYLLSNLLDYVLERRKTDRK